MYMYYYCTHSVHCLYVYTHRCTHTPDVHTLYTVCMYVCMCTRHMYIYFTLFVLYSVHDIVWCVYYMICVYNVHVLNFINAHVLNTLDVSFVI